MVKDPIMNKVRPAAEVDADREEAALHGKIEFATKPSLLKSEKNLERYYQALVAKKAMVFKSEPKKNKESPKRR